MVAISCARGGSRQIFGKIFFSERVMSYWNRLPREVVESLSLEVIKKHVDVAVKDKV